MSAATLTSPQIAQFATAVRAALGDLTPDEIDDLTDGLEADLTERLADGDAIELGDPLAYAEELRTAAGLPRRARQSPSFLDEAKAIPAAVARALKAFAARHGWVNALGQFLVSIRPVWWVSRGVAATWLVMNVLGWGVQTTMVVGLVATVISIQFGRGRWVPFDWMRALLLIANIVLVIATPFVAAWAVNYITSASYAQMYEESSPNFSGTGLLENGNPVSNIFAYDAAGNPLTNVQLFDQDGKPLDLVGDPTTRYYYNVDGTDSLVVPNSTVPGRLGWNVFPLARIDASDVSEDGTVSSSVTPSPAVAPFGTAKPLASTGSSPTAAPTASPSPIPTP